MRYWEWLWVISVFLSSFILGSIYSLHHTDPHHWGYITSMILNFEAGKTPFQDYYVQYGVGQSLFFDLMKNVIPTTMTNVGLVTAFLYSLSLTLLYFAIRAWAGSILAIFLSLFSVLLHSYSIYPWSDYYAGFFLLLGASLLSRSEGAFGFKNKAIVNLLLPLLVGFLWFLAVLFRSTYLINIGLAGFGFLGLAWVPRFSFLRVRDIVVSIFTFFFLVLFYLFYLLQKGLLIFWYRQSLGASGGYYGAGIRTLFALLEKAFLFHDLHQIAFSVMLWVSVFFTYDILIGKGRIFDSFRAPKLVLFSLLAWGGLIQGALGYEFFRIQNSCSPLYFCVGAFFFDRLTHSRADFFSKQLKFLVILVFLSMAFRYPHGSNIWPVFEGHLKDYQESRVSYYQGHRFKPEFEGYYQNLEKLICRPGSRVFNFTMDSSIPDLCGEPKSGLPLPFWNEDLLKYSFPSTVQALKQGRYQKGDIIVSHPPYPLMGGLILHSLGTVYRPDLVRYLGGRAEVPVFEVLAAPDKLRKSSLIHSEGSLIYL